MKCELIYQLYQHQQKHSATYYIFYYYNNLNGQLDATINIIDNYNQLNSWL
jgi:hypothetical protein